MSNSQRKHLHLPTLDEVRTEKARRHLVDFLEYDGQGQWRRAKHLELLCAELEAVEAAVRRGDGARLMVFMPPRHGKSEVTSKKAPAYFLARNPGWEIIMASYAADLAYDFSRIARNTLRQHGDSLWRVRLADDSGAVGRWGIDGHRGGLVAAGVGGPITGRGAHIAIIDDPIKNAEEAASQVIRDRIYDWYRSTLRTRLAPGGAIVLVLTRWHEDDLAGRLLKEAANGGGEQWRVISLPAIAGVDDALGRHPGDVLWPERFRAQEYEATRIALGSYLWSALYQQSPLPSGGGIFKREWFRIVEPDRVPGDLAWVRYWDLATSTRTAADCTASARVALGVDGTLWIDGGIASRWEWPDARRMIVQTALLEGTAVPLGIERVGFQGAAVQEMLREPQLVAHTILGVPVDRDKVQRAMPWAARAEAGKVNLVTGEWVGPWLDEITAFPYGTHDDRVDAVSGGLQMLAGIADAWDDYEADDNYRA